MGEGSGRPDQIVRAGAESVNVPGMAEAALALGMGMITSNRDAHMSTRNTVCCMGQGKGAGTAAALCAGRTFGGEDGAHAGDS